jgi:CHAT domain-containing protein
MLTPFRGARPGCAAFEQLRFARLPQTRREIGDVHRLWKQAHRKEGLVELTGRQANEARVKAELPGKRVVHLATHGFFLGDECPTTESAGATRHVGATVAPATPLATASLENPLLLSGLALAGSNQRQQAVPGTEDGVLTAEEVASLDLRGVEWAVLSACETAAGDVRAGEGVFGLRRAFETAGAHTLIMSLWSVEDEAGRAWMDQLYHARFADGRSSASAVQQADLRVLAARRDKRLSTHPSVWAGFIAAGDWR